MHWKPLVIVLFAQVSLVAAQDAPRYRAWLTSTTDSLADPCFLQSTGDSGVWMMSRSGGRVMDGALYRDAVTIERLQFRRQGNVGRGMAIFGGVGTVLGALFAVGENGSFSGTTFGIGSAVGIGLGAAIGSARVTINLGGRRSNYQRLRNTIDGYAVTRKP